jgi:acetyl-CoA carboxylase carboxyl transferase subunit beta
MSFFSKPKYSTVTLKKKDIPKDLWVKCPQSGAILYNKQLEQNLMVVPQSGYHFPLAAWPRIHSLVDEGSFTEHDAGVVSADSLQFKGLAPYPEKLKEHQHKTQLPEAVVSGMGTLHGIPLSLAVMDFRFLGASLGGAAGEKITRAIERGLERKIPVVIVCASGGARMYEGIFSLMQLAKTSAALSRLKAAGLPYIPVLTHPTMAGVMASFATLGDVILAEPGALIGFAGPRVIKETTRQELPEGFQTAEFLFSRGLIDQIVPRPLLRGRLHSLLRVLWRPGSATLAPAPFGAAVGGH